MPKTEAQKARRREKKKLAKAKKPVVVVVQAPKKKKARKSYASSAVSGHGDYKSVSRTGASFAKAGGLVGDLADHLFGTGDYSAQLDNISYNTLMSKGAPHFENKVHGFGTNTTEVQHKDEIGSIAGSTNFTVTEYQLTPADPNTFPWLNTQAASYSQYCIRGLIVWFESTIKDAVGLTPGSVGLAVQYNDIDVPFTSMSELANYQYASVRSGSQNNACGVECAVKSEPQAILYLPGPVRAGYLPGDIREQVFGRLCVGTQGQNFTTEVGRLYVSYDIVLLKAKLGYPPSVAMIPFSDVANTAKGNLQFWSAAGPIVNNNFLSTAASSRTVFGRYSFLVNDASLTAAGSSVTFYDTRLSGRVLMVTVWSTSNNPWSLLFGGLAGNSSNTTISALSQLQPVGVTSGLNGTATFLVNCAIGSGPWTFGISHIATWNGSVVLTYMNVVMAA